MLFEDMLQKCNELAEEAIDTAIVVSPKDCGLDRRAASRNPLVPCISIRDDLAEAGVAFAAPKWRA